MSENRNRHGQKNTDAENRTGKTPQKSDQYKKLPDDDMNAPDESISTRDDTSNGKYSRVNKRDDEVDNEDTRGGR